MRQSKAKRMRKDVIRETVKRGVPFKKLFIRRAKRMYNQIPRTEREKFTIYSFNKTPQ